MDDDDRAVVKKQIRRIRIGIFRTVQFLSFTLKSQSELKNKASNCILF